jgi:uncharacterized membrane protein YfcA
MSFDLSLWHIAAISGAYFFAATAKGVTGIGFTTTCLPILALLFGLKDALPLVIIPSVLSNLVVMRQAGHFGETIARFWPLLLALLPGLALGLWMLSQIDGELASGILGVTLILWIVFTLAKPDLSLPAHLERPLAPLTGFVTGTINGVTGSQVMPVVPFLMMLKMPRDLFLQAVNCSFTLSSFVMAFGLGRLGLFSLQDVVISGAGSLVMVLGVSLGGAIRPRLPETLFRKAILLMLSATALSLIVPVL